MKASRAIKLWFQTREPRRLWWSIPLFLAIAAWAAFGLCLINWRHQEIAARYAGLADHALAGKDFESARIAAQRLLGLGAEPRDKWIFELALAKAGLGRDKEASTIFASVAPLEKPGYLPAHLFLAQALLMRTNATPQDIKTAERHLVHALSLDPRFLGANELLAQVYIREGHWELACQRLLEVVAVQPEAALLLAVVFKARGDGASARSWAERASRFHREKVEASKLDLPKHRLAWAEALVLLEDLPAAFDVLEKGWNLSASKDYAAPMGDVCAGWVMALVKSKPADLDARIEIIQKGLKYAPQNELLLRQLVDLSKLEGPEAQTARDALTKSLAEGKSSAVIHFALGLDAWQHGQPDLARQHFALSYESAPQMPDVANNMAMILAVGTPTDLSRALAIIQSTLEKFPDNPNFRETRGEILVKLGRWQEAVVDLEFALPKLGTRRNTHAALAAAYAGLGSQDLALQHQRLAKASPEPPGPPRPTPQ
jgi:tetratricopeptide (TPR) repeat protein